MEKEIGLSGNFFNFQFQQISLWIARVTLIATPKTIDLAQHSESSCRNIFLGIRVIQKN
jgi:hypothetical protein